MALTSEDRANAQKITQEWCWQPESVRKNQIVRFYEAASCSPDLLKLVIEYLKDETASVITLLNKQHALDGSWTAVDAWYQTSPNDKWQGTESTKIRIYQALRPAADATGGPYTVENGCQYQTSHTFYWDVATVASPPPSSSGISYTVQGISRDRQSGLFSYVVERRERVQQDVPEYGSAMTIYETTKREEHRGVQGDATQGGKAASVGGGKMVRRQVHKNDDCTHDVTNETITEEAVKDAEVTVEVDLDGTAERRMDRNQKSAASTANLKPGESVRNEKTPGGLYNIVRTVIKAVAGGFLGSSCAKDIYEHRHSERKNQKDNPGGDVANAGGGVVKRRTVQRTAKGTYNVEDETVEELGVEGASKSAARTLTEDVRSQTDRNAVAPHDADTLNIGESIESQQTPGGRWNRTKRKVIKVAAWLRGSIQRTAFQEEVSTVSFVPETAEQIEPVDEAEHGVTRQRTVANAQDGGAEVTDTVRTEMAVSKSTRSMHRTPFVCEVQYEDHAAIDKDNANGEFLPSFKGRTDEQPAPTKDGNAAMLVGESYEVTPGKMANRRRIFRFIKARSWKTPLVDTNNLYKQTIYFQNFTKAQTEDLGRQCAEFFDNKVRKWVNDGRPPASHDIDHSVKINENGFYDGTIVYFARWGMDDAGQKGEVNAIISKSSWTEYKLKVEETQSNYYGSVTKTGYWLADKQTRYRISGRGKAKFNEVMSGNICAGSFDASYNPSNGKWVITGVVELTPNVRVHPSSIWATNRKFAALQEVTNIAPTPSGRQAEPDISSTEY